MPREALGPLLDLEAREERVDGWTVAAVEAADLRRAEALVGRLRGLEGPAGDGLELALWVDPRRVAPTLHRLADDMERIPLVKRRQVRAWRAGALAARALDDFRLLTLKVVGEGAAPGLELRLTETTPTAPMPY